jgi:hypothetical protein
MKLGSFRQLRPGLALLPKLGSFRLESSHQLTPILRHHRGFPRNWVRSVGTIRFFEAFLLGQAQPQQSLSASNCDQDSLPKIGFVFARGNLLDPFQRGAMFSICSPYCSGLARPNAALGHSV